MGRLPKDREIQAIKRRVALVLLIIEIGRAHV